MSAKDTHLLKVSPRVTDYRHESYVPTVCSPTQTNASDSPIILPKWIYIKDKDGRYLFNRSGPIYSTITFRSGDPDLDAAFETSQVAPSWYKLIARTGEDIDRYYDGWYSADGDGSPFKVITCNGGKVYLKDNYNPALFFSNELNAGGAPVAHNYINSTSEMEIVQAAVKNDIIDVVYDINGGQVHDAPPVVALSTSVRNDSDSDVSQSLTYSYEKWSVGTWNNTAGIEVGVKTSFSAGVPFVANADFEISVSASYSHEWGGEEGTKQTVTETTTVTVPPRKKATATIIVRNAQIDVGFTYTQKILWSNGDSETTTKTGIYTNVDSWHVDVVLDNWEPL